MEIIAIMVGALTTAVSGMVVMLFKIEHRLTRIETKIELKL